MARPDLRLSQGLTPVRADDEIVTPGGPGDNGGMEARVAKLEAAVEHIQRDISDIRTDIRDIRGELRGVHSAMRTHFYWMIGAFAAVLAVMAKGFGWL